MESQDGISVRPMRLKVLYTFDDASKTNCLARWPHLLEIQTAALDEMTQIGVIELKTCIQAIVSASPELVAQLGKDYTVYAYDYSEYETPLVGQGMLSWVLASASPTPNAPAHQSETMVTGRVCKNVLGLFSKGAQETLEVKLRLVPVPTVMQSEYLESMRKYRELSNIIPHEFDAQAWTNFLRQNPGLITPSHTQQPERTASPMDHTGIERFHRLLSEGSTPRELPSAPANGSYRSVSPAQSALAPGSRVSTPGDQLSHFQQEPLSQQTQQQPQPQPLLNRAQSDIIRPSSSASMRDSDYAAQGRYASRRGSIQSGYGSCDESAESQPRKRAKLYRAEWPGKSDFNIDRQPSSLRVAASTAASVRIHRPTPINPAIAAAQNSPEEPVRPPTPISTTTDFPRRAHPLPSLLRESSVQSNNYESPYNASDDQTPVELNTQSPEESRYQGLFEPSFSMPSSPPVLDCHFPGRSSPVLPPMVTESDSGFMSGGVEELLDEDIGTPLEDYTRPATNDATSEKPGDCLAVHASSPVGSRVNPEVRNENTPISDESQGQSTKDSAPVYPRAPTSNAGSRPSSRASFRQAPKPLAPAPMSQSEIEQLISAIPASDPVMPSQPQGQNSNWAAGPMSDYSAAETPAPQRVAEDGKVRSGAGARRLRQVQARLDKAIRDGQVPPYCENCGAIETPTWRRAWSKEMNGNEQEADEMKKDSGMLFWQSLERDGQDKVTKFKIYKKSLADIDNDFAQVLLCNPCGLWLHKFKCMRPENKWNKSSNGKRKRPPRNRRGGGPLSTNGTSTRSQSRAGLTKADGSSPVASEASSPAAEDGTTPREGNSNENENEDEAQEPPSKRRRATSLEPRKSSDTTGSRWQEDDAIAALRRAIQSSPARNLESRNSATAGENSLTPKSVRRVLFPNSQAEGGPLKALGESILNSPRRSPRVTHESAKRSQDKENDASDLDGLFGNPTFEIDLPTSPTPRRRNPRTGMMGEKSLPLPCNSPSSKVPKDINTTPTKLTAKRLQHIQNSPVLTPRQGKTPKQSRLHFPGLPSLPNDAFNADAFGGMDKAIVDIFSDTADATNADLFSFDPSKCSSSSNWPDWLPSDYVSPNGSEEEQNNADDDSGNLIDALLSNSDKSQFDIFNLDSNILDSGFFSSDALDTDVMAVSVKNKSIEGSSHKEQAYHNTPNAS